VVSEPFCSTPPPPPVFPFSAKPCAGWPSSFSAAGRRPGCLLRNFAPANSAASGAVARRATVAAAAVVLCRCRRRRRRRFRRRRRRFGRFRGSPRSSRRRPGFLPPPRTSTAALDVTRADTARGRFRISVPALITAAWPVSGFSWALITAAAHFRGADCGYCADFSGANSRPPSQGRWVLLLLRFPAAVAFSLGFRILKPSYSHREFSGQKIVCFKFSG